MLKKEEPHHRTIAMVGILAVIAAFILLAPITWRATHGALLPGIEPYGWAGIAEWMLGNSPAVPHVAEGIAGRVFIFAQPYVWLVTAATALLGRTLTGFILPFIIVVIAGAFLWRLLGMLERSHLERVLALLLFVISPLALFSASTSSRISLNLVLITALGMYAASCRARGKEWGVLGLLLGLLLALSAPLAGVAMMIMIAGITKRMSSLLWISLGLSGVVAFATGMLSSAWLFGDAFLVPAANTGINGLIADLGGITGMSTLLFFLGIAGLVLLWHNHPAKEKEVLMRKISVAVVVLTILSLFASALVPLTVLVYIILGARALRILFSSQWHHPEIKQFTVFVIFCGLFFSGIAAAQQLGSAEPRPGVMSALEWVRENTPPGDVVLTAPDSAYWVEVVAHRNVIADLSDLPQSIRADDAQMLLTSKNFTKSQELFAAYGAKTILITKEMKEQIWHRDDEGLLFLIANPNAFDNPYQDEFAEVWRVRGGTVR